VRTREERKLFEDGRRQTTLTSEAAMPLVFGAPASHSDAERGSTIDPIFAWRRLCIFIRMTKTMGKPTLSGELSIDGFLDGLSSVDAPHGGVSACGLVGAMGVALLLRATSLPQTRSDSGEERLALAVIAAALQQLRAQFVEAIETETAAKILAARNMPQADESQRARRHRALQVALRAAAEVPLEIMRLSAAALAQASLAAPQVSRATWGDIELALDFLRAALHGARTNLEFKLTSLTDVMYARDVVEEITRLTEEGAKAALDAETLITTPHA
jgi:formiminotetrahydrofolate cyclodeaminase